MTCWCKGKEWVFHLVYNRQNWKMFEGYVGIRLWEGQLFGDVIFSIELIMLLLFAISSRVQVKSFINMFRVCASNRSKMNPDISVYYSKVLNSVLTVQAIILFSLALVQYEYANGYTYVVKEGKLEAYILLTFFSVFVYYFLRRFSYKILIFIFASPEYYRQWKLNYNSIIGVWGILMYVPVVAQSVSRGLSRVCVTLFILLYILSRFAIIYKSIRLFSIKKFDLFYLSLYLCAHEILPLWIMYKGLIYLYNFIEKSAIWH